MGGGGNLCAIASCKNSPRRCTKTGETIVFFGFPTDRKLRKEWIKSCCWKKNFNADNKKICHKHFSLNDYEDALGAELCNRRPTTLKRKAIPSLFLGPDQEDKSIACTPKERQALKKYNESVQKLSSKGSLTEEIVQDKLKTKKCTFLPKESEMSFGQSFEKAPPVPSEEETLSKCLVCDKVLKSSELNSFSRADLAQIIKKLLQAVSDNFVMVLKEEDQLCRACNKLVSRISQLEAELRTANFALRALLRIKYSLDFSFNNIEEPGAISVSSNTYSTIIEKQVNKTMLSNSIRSAPVKDMLMSTSITAEDQWPVKVSKGTQVNIPVNSFFPAQIVLFSQCAIPEKSEKQMPCSISHIQSLPVEEYDKLKSNEVTGSKYVPKMLDESECMGFVTGKTENTGDNQQTPNQEKAVNEMSHQSSKDCEISNQVSENCNVAAQTKLETCKQLFKEKLEKAYECGMCSFKTNSTTELKAHYSEFEKKEGYYCSICEYTFHKQNFLKNHMARHAKLGGNHPCVSCGLIIHDRLHMRFHYQLKHKPNGLSHTCALCNKVFIQKRSLRNHTARFHKKLPERWSCDKCKAIFNDVIKYEKHTQYSHRKSLNCTFCSRSLPDVEQLFKHEYYHKMRKRQLYQCHHCPKKFLSILKLNFHEKQHLESVMCKCKVCGLGFYEMKTFKKHSCPVKKHNIISTPLICDVCGKIYRSRNSYLAHRILHDNPQPFKCDICLKRFRYKSKLYNHRKQYHQVNTTDETQMIKPADEDPTSEDQINNRT